MSEEIDKIRSVTLRVAIFFGLTTFTLCIAIFYIESILDDTYAVMDRGQVVLSGNREDMSEDHVRRHLSV